MFLLGQFSTVWTCQLRATLNHHTTSLKIGIFEHIFVQRYKKASAVTQQRNQDSAKRVALVSDLPGPFTKVGERLNIRQVSQTQRGTRNVKISPRGAARRTLDAFIRPEVAKRDAIFARRKIARKAREQKTRG